MLYRIFSKNDKTPQIFLEIQQAFTNILKHMHLFQLYFNVL